MLLICQKQTSKTSYVCVRAGHPGLLLESLVMTQQFGTGRAVLAALPSLHNDDMLTLYARSASQCAARRKESLVSGLWPKHALDAAHADEACLPF